MAVTGGIIAVIGLGVSIDEGKRQTRAAVRQKRAARAVDFGKQQKERRAALREKRVRIAQLNVASEATGVSGSSGELATETAIATNFAVNVGFGNMLQEARDVIGTNQITAAKSRIKQGLGQSVQNIGFNIFQANDGFEQLFGE